MKKTTFLALVLVMVVGILAGCGGNTSNTTSQSSNSESSTPISEEAKSTTASEETTPAPASEETKPTYVLDFEKTEMLVGPTICFDPEFTKGNILFEPQEGFSGNVYKAYIKAKEQGATWWVSGVAMSKEGSSDEGFKDLKSITFKYTSTVEYVESPFIVQLVWKDKASGDEVAKIETQFKMEKTSDIKTFKIDVPEDVTSDLNAAKDFYLDWFMVGLKDTIGDKFRPGTMCIDDVSFFNK